MPRSRVRLFVIAVLLIAALVAAAFTGCLPAYTFGEGGPGDGGGDVATIDSSLGVESDSSNDSASGFDAGSDASQDSAPSIPFDGSIATIAIADAGSKVGSTGYGYQLHVVFAQNDGRYWYFFVDDATGEIETRSSPDFATWTAGSPIVLGGGYVIDDGNNFSVAYANVASKDVVHLVVNAHAGGSYMTLHVRATIAGGAIAAPPPVALPQSTNGGTCTDDAPATTITPSGRVYDVTAWTAHGGDGTTCDTDIYRSPGVDLGTSWDAGAFSYDGYYVSLPSYAYSHDLVALPDAGLVMLLYPDEDNAALTSFDSIGWDLSTNFDGGMPGAGGGVRETAGDELFAGTNKQASSNDWSACRLAGSEVHVVRHVLSAAGNSVSSFQEVVYDGSNWQTTTPPLASSSLSNTGVALLSDATPAHGMVMVTLAPDFALDVAKWTSGAGWTQVGKLPGTNPRQSLAGSGCGSARPTVFWTETIGSANVIESADLSGFLRP